MKKAIILYDSVYSNTKKVAMSLSRGLEAGGVPVDSCSIEDFDIVELQNYDIIGIGGPTHYHSASKKMKLFLKKIKNLKMRGKYGFVFETKGEFRLAGSAAKRITRYLNKTKIEIIHPAITGIVLNQEGPLKDETLAYMEQVGLNITDMINNNNSQQNINRRVEH